MPRQRLEAPDAGREIRAALNPTCRTHTIATFECKAIRFEIVWPAIHTQRSELGSHTLNVVSVAEVGHVHHDYGESAAFVYVSSRLEKVTQSASAPRSHHALENNISALRETDVCNPFAAVALVGSSAVPTPALCDVTLPAAPWQPEHAVLVASAFARWRLMRRRLLLLLLLLRRWRLLRLLPCVARSIVPTIDCAATAARLPRLAAALAAWSTGAGAALLAVARRHNEESMMRISLPRNSRRNSYRKMWVWGEKASKRHPIRSERHDHPLGRVCAENLSSARAPRWAARHAPRVASPPLPWCNEIDTYYTQSVVCSLSLSSCRCCRWGRPTTQGPRPGRGSTKPKSHEQSPRRREHARPQLHSRRPLRGGSSDASTAACPRP